MPAASGEDATSSAASATKAGKLSPTHTFTFLFNVFYVYGWFCLAVHCGGLVPTESRGGCWTPGTVATDGCEHHVGAGN